jgi:hypothetical protein
MKEMAMKDIMLLATAGIFSALGLSCGTSVGGGGGDTNQGENDGGGGACNVSDYGFPECCSVPDHQPCKGFTKADCTAHAYCAAITASPFDDQNAPPQYIGCASGCGLYPIGPSGLYDPADPSTCYYNVSGRFPDGWIEFEPGQPPAGACGK